MTNLSQRLHLLPQRRQPLRRSFQQHCAQNAHNRRIVGEDAQHAGAAFDFPVDPCEQVGIPDLSQVLVDEVEEGELGFQGLKR